MDNFLELLKHRRSCRLFTEQPVEEDKVCDLMKAALNQLGDGCSRPHGSFHLRRRP